MAQNDESATAHDGAYAHKPHKHLTTMFCIDRPDVRCKDAINTCYAWGYECMNDGSEHATHETADCSICKGARGEQVSS